MIHAVINGIDVEADEHTTILEAANQYGIEIPTLCYLKGIAAESTCRICMVEIKGRPRLVAACSTYLAEGNVIETESGKVIASRQSTLDLLLSNHDKHCSACSFHEECRLKRYCDRYGLEASSFPKDTPNVPVDDSNPYFVYDPNLCIMCYCCINTCQHMNGLGVIDVLYQGRQPVVSPVRGYNWADSECDSCGNCVGNCPTGALQFKWRSSYTLDEVNTVQTTCPYCGIGCQLSVLAKEGRIADVRPADGGVNQGILCGKGRYLFLSAYDNRRLQYPQIKKNGKLVNAEWEEAFAFIAQKISEIKLRFGADAMMGMTDSCCTNEEQFLFHKLFRTAIGTNQVDYFRPGGGSGAEKGIYTALGNSAMPNPVRDIKKAEVIFLLGNSALSDDPLLAMFLRQAVREKKKLVVIDSKESDISKLAALFLKIQPGSGVNLFHTMLHVILKEHWENKEYIAFHTEGLNELRELVKLYDLKQGELITGVLRKNIKKAARLYALSHSCFVFGTDIAELADPCHLAMGMSNLALVTGNLGKSGAGIYPFGLHCNSQGVLDMAGRPVFYTGVNPIRIMERKIKLLYIMADGGLHTAGEHLEMMKNHGDIFLIVQDSVQSELTDMADVVLPASCFVEKTGTITSVERRVQLVNQVLPAHSDVKQGWEILMELLNRLGCSCNYDSEKAVFKEICSCVSGYDGMTYEKIKEQNGICRPYGQDKISGDPILHQDGPSGKKGIGLLRGMDWKEKSESQDAEYPWMLTSCRMLYHYQTRRILYNDVRKAYSSCDQYIEMNPNDMELYGIQPGEWVKVISETGSISCEVHVEPSLEPGVIWIPPYLNWTDSLNESSDAGTIFEQNQIQQIAVKIEKERIE